MLVAFFAVHMVTTARMTLFDSQGSGIAIFWMLNVLELLLLWLAYKADITWTKVLSVVVLARHILILVDLRVGMENHPMSTTLYRIYQNALICFFLIVIVNAVFESWLFR